MLDFRNSNRSFLKYSTFKFCSPSRSSLLSGRLPVHVNIYNDDPARPGAGVPTGMTMISEKLAGAGYLGHFIGKWCGAAAHLSLPVRPFLSVSDDSWGAGM